MSRDVTEVIDGICETQYGHTNWAFADTLTEEELKEVKDKKLGDKMPSIIFYHDDVKDMYRYVVYKNCEKGWKIDKIFEDEDDAGQYVDEYKEELKLDDTSIKYVHEELTEEELEKYEGDNNE